MKNGQVGVMTSFHTSKLLFDRYTLFRVSVHRSSLVPSASEVNSFLS